MPFIHTLPATVEVNMESQVQIPAAPSPIYSRWRSWFLLFSCNLMWALQFTCVKLVQDQVGPVFTVWGPMTFATRMLYPCRHVW